MTVHMKGKQEISWYEPQSNFLSVNRVNEARDTLIPRDAYLFRPDRTPYMQIYFIKKFKGAASFNYSKKYFIGARIEPGTDEVNRN